jgi:hypothetical protein
MKTILLLAGLGLLIGDAAWAMPRSPGARLVAAAGRKKGKKRTPRRRRPVKAVQEEVTVPLGADGKFRVKFEPIDLTAQHAKPGDVRLLHRRSADIKSMVKRRTAFTSEIIRTVFRDYSRAPER